MQNRQRHRVGWQLILALTLSAPALAVGATGERVNLAEFGDPVADGGFGVAWVNPLVVREVAVAGIPADAARRLRLEWWGSQWPGIGDGGWKRADDPWNGRWVRVPTEPLTADGEPGCRFAFPPLKPEEFDRALKADEYPDKQLPTYRTTLKIRVVREDGQPLDWPSEARLHIFGDARWAEGWFDVQRRLDDRGRSQACVRVINGQLLDLSALPGPAAEVNDPCWHAEGMPGGPAGLRVHVRYVENPDRNANDLTRVQVLLDGQGDESGFSFVPQDVLAVDAMRVYALNTIICAAGRGIDFANDPGPDPKAWSGTVRQRVARTPEMTRAAAMAGMPRLQDKRWAPLGVPSARQEAYINERGDWSFWIHSLQHRFEEAFKAGRDSQHIPFYRKDSDRLNAEMDTRPEPVFDGADRGDPVRYMEENYLPLMHCTWHNGPIRYHHSFATTILIGDYGDDATRRGDETVVLLSRLEVTNSANEPAVAQIHLRWTEGSKLQNDPDGLIRIVPGEVTIPEGLTPVRTLISMDKPTGGGAADWKLTGTADAEHSQRLSWQAELAPGQTRRIYFKSPFVHLLESAELDRLARINYEEEVPRTLDYWRDRLARHMVIDVPDKAVNDFYKANLWHISITTDRDPKTGLYNQGVGTVQYGVFANETVMIARSMDMRGEHTEAERFLEPMIHFQGTVPLKGRFSTSEGAFHGAGAYTHGEYAMNHGFVLWGIADHYLMTRDDAFLQRVMPNLLRGVDFMVKERSANLTPPGQPLWLHHGLAPASSLEDVVEYQYWIAVNGYFCFGLKKVADALHAAGHPEAERVAREAEAYRQDVVRAARRATAMAAAVPLRDGTFIPYVPSRLHHWRHLTEGWIREALYPTLQLATAEVVPPTDPLITWMLDELEDNIFFSAESGYDVPNVDDNWFHLGAVTLQPCLVDTPTIYMARDEIPAALRSLWNSYALSLYPDVNCFAEWARHIGQGAGPIYKTSDEARWVMWLREFLLWERGDVLWLGRAMPREWMEPGRQVRIERARTFFGEAGLHLISQLDEQRIVAEVQLPQRHAPRQVWLRFRHPTGLKPTQVLIDGTALPAERVVGEDVCLYDGTGTIPATLKVVAEYAPPAQ